MTCPLFLNEVIGVCRIDYDRCTDINYLKDTDEADIFNLHFYGCPDVERIDVAMFFQCRYNLFLQQDGKLLASGNMDDIVKDNKSLEDIFMEAVNDGETD